MACTQCNSLAWDAFTHNTRHYEAPTLIPSQKTTFAWNPCYIPPLITHYLPHRLTRGVLPLTQGVCPCTPLAYSNYRSSCFVLASFWLLLSLTLFFFCNWICINTSKLHNSLLPYVDLVYVPMDAMVLYASYTKTLHWREYDSFRYTRPQPSCLIKHRKTRMKRDISSTKQKWKSTQDVSVENPNLGKTTAALRLQDITMWGLQWWGTETTISCSLASPTGGYNIGNDLFLSLSLTLSVYRYAVHEHT